MIVLNSTSSVLEVKLSASVTTNQLGCYASLRTTYDTGDISPEGLIAPTNNTTTVNIVSAPASGSQKNIDYVSVYNSDTASAEVTISVWNGSIRVTLFKTVLAVGEKLEYVNGIGWQVLTTAGSAKQSINQGTAPVTSGSNITVLASSVTNSNAVANTLEDVTGMSFAVTAGAKYYFRFVIGYTVATTTTGARYALNGPSIAALAYWYGIGTSPTARTVGQYSTYGNPATSVASSAATGLNMVILEGFYSPSANGSLQLQAASEVAATAVTTEAGYSFVEWRQLA